MTSQSDPGAPGADQEPASSIADRSRFVAALAYVPTLCFLPYFATPDDDYARAHGRQAFLILFTAAVLGIGIRIVEWSMGSLPVLGALVLVIGRLVFGVGLVLLSGLGALRALSGERKTLDILVRYSERLPI
jgi:hypothetical protein